MFSIVSSFLFASFVPLRERVFISDKAYYNETGRTGQMFHRHLAEKMKPWRDFPVILYRTINPCCVNH